MSAKSLNGLESLEVRRMFNTGFDFGVLEVQGTDAADQITLNETLHITQTSSGFYRTDHFVRVTETTGQTTRTTEVPLNEVRFIYIEAHDGNDTITNQTDLGASVFGQGGNDTITGGGGRDYLYGDATFIDGFGYVDFNPGGDLIRGGGGDDYIEGNAGDDTLYGGASNDTIVGGAGVDEMYGETGNDTLRAKDGNGFETVDGGEGNDTAEIDDFLKRITTGPLAGLSFRIRDNVFGVETITV
jgi:Ca2+-binding RTX toxin-like protein